MKPLGVDLGKLADDAAPIRTGAPDCPGAALRVMRHDYDELGRGGERFQTARQAIPVEGYGDARIACSNPVAQLPKTTSGFVQYYGLCHSCSGLEADNRQMLRDRVRAKEGR